MSIRPLPLLLLCVAGCSSELVEPGRLRLVHGDEPDPFSEAPPTTRVTVERVTSAGERKTVYDAATPPKDFELGQGGIVSFEVQGFAEDGSRRVWGRSIPIQTAGVAGLSLPLFVSRAARFARAPGRLQSTTAGPLAVIGGRFLMAFGGTDGDRAGADGYDLGVWAPLRTAPSFGCPSPPCRIESTAVAGDVVLAIGADWAIWVNFSDGSSGDAPLPEGLDSWSELAGGKTVESDDAQYVVGPTRPGSPSGWAVRVDADGTLTALKLSTRQGAAAAWAAGHGLVVAGGSASVAGVEVLAPGATASVVLPYPSDETVGAALLAKNDGVWRTGGTVQGIPAPTVELSLTCGTGCTASDVGSPLQLSDVVAVDLGSDFIAVGSDAGGRTKARLGVAGSDVELRVPRSKAAALLLPTGHVAVMGGVDLDGQPVREVELYAP
ncbi:MAG: hypothetical protein R3B13_28770 [Polyangiaceae bacterium]